LGHSELHVQGRKPQLGNPNWVDWKVYSATEKTAECARYMYLYAPIGFLQMLSQVLAIAIIWTSQQKHLRFFGSGKRNKWREHTVHCCLLRIGFWECCLTVWQRTFVRRIQYSWNSPTAFLSVGQYLVQPVFLFSITGLNWSYLIFLSIRMRSHLLTYFIFQNGTF